MLILVFLVALTSTYTPTTTAALFNANFNFKALANYYLGEFGEGSPMNKTRDYENMSPEELGLSRGQCQYVFTDYIAHKDRLVCAPDDHHIQHLLAPSGKEPGSKPPIMMKCLQPEISANATRNDNTLLMIDSVQQVIALLKPIGNATKRDEPGSCVVMLFTTDTCLPCAKIAPFANALPLLFPTLRIAAIDAFRFPSFNTEFGIVGLPAMLIFHQGRPIVKFYNDISYHGFITRHTGIKSSKPPSWVPSEEEISHPLPLQPIEKPDYVLVLAWGFILLCAGHYFAKSRWCRQFVEMIKRNWRESEAQLERN